VTIEVTHAFVSEKSDGTDSSRIQPSNWNAAHTFTMATNRILGRKTASTGAVEELTTDDVWDILGFVGTTAKLFQQTAAPTGWTKGTTHNNKALRLVTGAASSGGTTAFTSVFTSRAIAEANLPAHTHTFSGTSASSGPHAITFARTSWTYDITTDTDSVDGTGGDSVLDSVNNNNDTISATAAAHTHTFSGTTASIGSSTAMDFAVQYVDVIVATKD
jgi:hypothetical protein